MRRDLSALDGRPFDLVVVGGGIHGAAVARDAALRGLAVSLLERDDFGAGTSGNSLGIVHGGLRDLKAADVARLRLMAAERRAWLTIAPHLVRPLPVLVPFGGRRRPGRAALAAALPLHDLLTADRNRGVAADRHVPRGRLLGRAETLGRAPWLAPDVEGAALVHDARMLDPDRLTLAVVRGAVEAGAVVANRVEATGLRLARGRVAGVTARDRLSGRDLDVRARVVVNAAGPWADWAGVRVAGPLALAMNVVLRRPGLAGETAVALPGDGTRLYFLAPWGDGAVSLGTGYWPHGPAPASVAPDAETVRSLLAQLGRSLGEPLAEDDVTRVLAGLLPCRPGTAE
ncbi:MAG TPA: FAD-dependent oxidoreductase, partial [Thermodesulfobacteriota bacterium]